MSKRFFIESVQSGIAGGMACGPMSGPVVSEIKVRDDKEKKEYYVCLAEVEGMPHYYVTDDGCFDVHMGDDVDFDLDPITSGEDYEDVFSDEDDEYMPLYKFLANIVRADWDIFDQYEDTDINQYVEDIDIPEYKDEDEE